MAMARLIHVNELRCLNILHINVCPVESKKFKSSLILKILIVIIIPVELQ